MGRLPVAPSLLLASLGTLALARPASADDLAVANDLFSRGLADMEAGRYETGCPALAESQRIEPRPGTLFTLATCEDRRGRVATATALYGDYLAMVERLPEARRLQHRDRAQLARAAREKLVTDVPELTLAPP